MTAKIAYFVHDLTDPAVQRRVRMLGAGGAAVTPIGFRRGPQPVNAIEGISVVEIGRSADGMLLRRALTVISALMKRGNLARHVVGSDAIIARNLEMLVLAAEARKRYAPEAKLVYECLDIHRILLSRRTDGFLLRALESKLWRQVDLLITSSPAFVRNYFTPRGFAAPITLVENKVLALGEDCLRATTPNRRSGPPWRIGWFGMIRCRKSLEILSSIARELDGRVEVVIRGRPSSAVFGDFNEAISGRTHVSYLGPYRNPTDLGEIYGDMHFVWAVDYYESGQNSAWLLPNRVYEGTFYGAVPIGLAGIETGSWLTEHAVGVVANEPLEARLIDFFRNLDEDGHANLAKAVAALPRGSLVADREDCRALVEAVCGSAIEPSWVTPSDHADSITVGPKPNRVGMRQ
jgi:succinoglycan biosynthesis protein ExoL